MSPNPQFLDGKLHILCSGNSRRVYDVVKFMVGVINTCKICKNAGVRCPVFFGIGNKSKILSLNRKYGSVKARISIVINLIYLA